MSSVMRLHPIHSLISCGLLLTVLLLLARQHSPYAAPSFPSPAFASGRGSSDLTLSQRLEQSEALFQRSKERRKELQVKYGTDPPAYPPNSPPYPPYTWWDFVYPAFNCPHERERVGAMGDGGKWVCGMSRIAKKPDCVVYSFGINGESSFEAEVLDRTECQLWGYDFSVSDFGPEVAGRPELAERSHFHAYGLAGKDAHGPTDKPPMYTLASLMAMNGHNFIDILKIDIEFYEFETMKDLLLQYEGRPLPFGQLQIEIHAWHSHFKQTSSLMTWWENLEKAGLRPFSNEPNLVYFNYAPQAPPEMQEYSFINVLGNHALISD